MKLLVTGATGFLGRHVVVEALRRGHHVRAMVRPDTSEDALPWRPTAGLTFVRADLRSPRGLREAVRGVDAVLHLAAAKTGDFYTQFRGTVNATENLLNAMAVESIRRLVQVSSFSVYDYEKLRCGSTLTEDSQLIDIYADRDAYAITKLLQEQLAREFAEEHGGLVTILRPGVIYGRGNSWTARLGVQWGHRWIRIGANAPLPLIYVEHCAEAVVLAAEKPASIGQTINLVDDDQPTQRRYMRALAAHAPERPTIIPINWSCMRLLARLAILTNNLLFGGRARLPGILIPARLHARCKPLRYDNQRMKSLLAIQPRYDLQTALARCFTTPESVVTPLADGHTVDKEVQDACASPI